MKDIIFVVFKDEGGGYNAIEGYYNLMVAGNDRAQLIREIRDAVKDYFGADYSARILLREFVDEVLQF